MFLFYLIETKHKIFLHRMTVVDRNWYGRGVGRGSTLYIYIYINRLGILTVNHKNNCYISVAKVSHFYYKKA